MCHVGITFPNLYLFITCVTMGVPTLQAKERQMTDETHSGPKGSVPLYPPNLIHTTPFHKLSAQGKSNFLVYP